MGARPNLPSHDGRGVEATPRPSSFGTPAGADDDDSIPGPQAAGRSEPARPASTTALLRQLGLRPRKRFSQSFLVDRRIPGQIVSAAEVGPDDDVLEIGPGLGVLTQALARRAGRVVAVELDRDLAAALPRLVPPNVQIVQADALAFDPAEWFAGPYKLVANLPYHITSPVVLRYLGLPRPPALLVLMVQREVAARIAAPVGQMSFLAVAVQSIARARIVRVVPPSAFHPRPKVESAVIRLDLLDEPIVPARERAAFLDLVTAGFAQPRKQLANSLAQGLDVPKPVALALLERAGIAAERRPQELSLVEWRALFRAR